MSECKTCHGTGRIEYGEFGFDCAAMHNGGFVPDAPGAEPCDDCEGSGVARDKYGNPTDGSRLINCCFPDCGCNGSRLCQAENGPSLSSMWLNYERGTKFKASSGDQQ